MDEALRWIPPSPKVTPLGTQDIIETPQKRSQKPAHGAYIVYLRASRHTANMFHVLPRIALRRMPNISLEPMAWKPTQSNGSAIQHHVSISKLEGQYLRPTTSASYSARERRSAWPILVRHAPWFLQIGKKKIFDMDPPPAII